MNLLKRMQAAHTDASKRLWLPRSGMLQWRYGAVENFLGFVVGFTPPCDVHARMGGVARCVVQCLHRCSCGLHLLRRNKGHWFSGPKKRPSSPPTLQGPPKRPFPVRWLKPEKHAPRTPMIFNLALAQRRLLDWANKGLSAGSTPDPSRYTRRKPSEMAPLHLFSARKCWREIFGRSKLVRRRAAQP